MPDKKVVIHMAGEEEPLEFTLTERDQKPRIRRLLDDYALESGQHWICTHAKICARGKTPKEAYDKLIEHFEFLREHRSRYAPGRVRA